MEDTLPLFLLYPYTDSWKKESKILAHSPFQVYKFIRTLTMFKMFEKLIVVIFNSKLFCLFLCICSIL